MCTISEGWSCITHISYLNKIYFNNIQRDMIKCLLRSLFISNQQSTNTSSAPTMYIHPSKHSGWQKNGINQAKLAVATKIFIFQWLINTKVYLQLLSQPTRVLTGQCFLRGFGDPGLFHPWALPPPKTLSPLLRLLHPASRLVNRKKGNDLTGQRSSIHNSWPHPTSQN